MRLFEFLGRTQIGDQGPSTYGWPTVGVGPLNQNDVPVVPRNNNRAGTSFHPLFHIVDLVEALSGVSSLELLSQIIVTDASGVHDGFWGEDVLNWSRDQNAYEGRFDKGHVLQHHEQRFGQLLQRRR